MACIAATHGCRRRVVLACAVSALAVVCHASPHHLQGQTPGPQIRFSGLAELTPENVDGLLPLSPVRAQVGSEAGDSNSQDRGLRTPAVERGSLAAVDARLRDFVSWRATLINAPLPSPAAPGIDTILSFRVASTAAVGVGHGELTAWDPVRRRAVWTTREESLTRSGAVVTAGGLVFLCSEQGALKALDAHTGKLLWTHRLAGARAGTPLSFLGPDGHQYVAVLTDARGGAGTLQAFSLPR